MSRLAQAAPIRQIINSVARAVPENMPSSQEIIVELLFTDLDIACTFLETARVSGWLETKRRNVAHAVKAYKDVSAKARFIEMPESVRHDLKMKLSSLKQELAALGQYM